MVTALLPAVEHFPLQAPPRPRPRRPGFVRCPPVPRGARCHGDPCCSPCQTRPRGTPNLRSRCGLSGMMKSSLTPLGPPVSRDRIIATFPKWYTPAACLQLKEHFHGQVNAACQRRNTGTVGLNLSKVVVVGDLYVGKTSLIHRFCKNVFDRDYKATIGVDFEIERFEIAGIPYSLQIWDTAGQEKFKCIASAYYRGAQGENVKAFFLRVAALAFEQSVLQDLERRDSSRLQLGTGDLIRMEGGLPETQESKRPSSLGCC
nr:PREDICTED: ras-related protein Rab-36 isoform X2 [Rhinolophus sinicus]